MWNTGGCASGAHVALEPLAIFHRPAGLALDPLSDATCAVAARPGTRQQLREIVRGQAIVGADDEAALRIHLPRHGLERNHA